MSDENPHMAVRSGDCPSCAMARDECLCGWAVNADAIQRAQQLEDAATELRSAATSVSHTHYWPMARDKMQKVADDLDKVAIKIRRDAA